MNDPKIMLITGTRKGIGKYLAHYYVNKGFTVIGCSRDPADFTLEGYQHFSLDVSDESAVKKMFGHIRKSSGRLDVLINNAGIHSTGHFLLTARSTLEEILKTNVLGTFLLCREASKFMQKNRWGRIVNFTTITVPLKLEGEAAYVSSKAAVEALTMVLARELAELGITVNAVGPTPIRTDFISSIPEEKLDLVIQRQAIARMGEFRDVVNIIDFFISPESDFVTGQVIYLGGP